MTFVTKDVEITIAGKLARTTREKLQPLVNANVRPAIVIANARIIVPIFSPRALYIACTSFPNLEESSVGLIVSNQALSCFKIDSKYLILVVLATLSLNISKNA